MGRGRLLARSRPPRTGTLLAAHAAKWLVHAVLRAACGGGLSRHQGRARARSRARGAPLGMRSASKRGVTLFRADAAALRRCDALRAAMPARCQRVIVSAAGIMVELLIAAMALAVWLNVAARPRARRRIRGRVHARAFRPSLVNGNPLLRFDGYYVFIDALDLPNLATRSARYWGALVRRHLLRVRWATRRSRGAGGAVVARAYAPLSWLYRVALCRRTHAWVGTHVVRARRAGSAYFRRRTARCPAVRAFKAAFYRAALDRRAAPRAAVVIGSPRCFVRARVLSLVPMPYGARVAQGVVWLPEHARVRAETDGFVTKIVARMARAVAKGDVRAGARQSAAYGRARAARRARGGARGRALRRRAATRQGRQCRRASSGSVAGRARAERRSVAAGLTVRAGARRHARHAASKAICRAAS